MSMEVEIKSLISYYVAEWNNTSSKVMEGTVQEKNQVSNMHIGNATILHSNHHIKAFRDNFISN